MVAGHPTAKQVDVADGRLTTVQVVERISAVVAPVTVLSALFVYFGFVRTTSFFGYFGIRQQMLNFSVQDYLFRSIDGSLDSALKLALVVGLVLALDQVLAAILARRESGTHRVRGALLWTAAIAGTAMLFLGLMAAATRDTTEIAYSIIGPAVLTLDSVSLIGPVALALGTILLIRFGSALFPQWQETHKRKIQHGKTIVLVTASFWAASHSAEVLGVESAAAVNVSPARYLPNITISTTESLGLTGRNVTVSQADNPQGGIRYRYAGLSLLTYANNQWFVISGEAANGLRTPVTILKDSDAIHVEVAE